MSDAIALIHECDVRVVVPQEHDVGDGPHGRRRYCEIRSAFMEGERLSGTLVGSAGDWMLVGPDACVRMDVRLQFRTADDAILCMRYFGPAEINERMRRAMSTSTPTAFSDQRIRTHWLMETGDERYAWVNGAVFVGEGRFRPDEDGCAGFEHRIYRLDRPPV